MGTVGLITEYNPFHNGHQHHLREALLRSGCDSSIAVMSGNFTQRGEAAMADKFHRAAAAVRCGVDIVLELPTVFSTGSAMDFADGAVSILSATGLVSHLAFGVETDDISLFYELTDILLHERCDYQNTLKDYLKEGFSYPAARSRAVSELYGEKYTSILSAPNNTLGLQYLLSIKRLNTDITPILIPRIKSGYHDKMAADSSLASATAVRESIKEKKDVQAYIPAEAERELSAFLSSPSTAVLHESKEFSSILLYCLMQADHNKLLQTMDCPDFLVSKLTKLSYPTSLEEVRNALRSKNITETRLNRVLLHLLLGITEQDRADARGLLTAFPYANLLSFRLDKSNLIQQMNEQSAIEVINKKSAYHPADPKASRLWEIDTKAHTFYAQLLSEVSGIKIPSELSSTVRIIK